MAAPAVAKGERARPTLAIAKACKGAGLVPRFVLCRRDKRPVEKRWQSIDPPPPARQADDWVNGRKGLLGIVPGSVGLFVVDIDEGGAAAVEAVSKLLGEPLASVATKRAGGRHLYYPAPDGEVRNRKWETPEGSGDIRGTRGYVILWDMADLAVAAAMVRARNAPPSDPMKLPGPRGLRGLPLDQVPTGARNEELNRRTWEAARCGNGRTVQKLVGQAKAAGLRPEEVESTVRSAMKAGAERPVFKRTDSRSLFGALSVLRTDIRYNLRAAAAEFREESGDWKPVTDRWLSDLRERIADVACYVNGMRQTVRLQFGREAFNSALLAMLNRRECDPFLMWLESLPEWDREPRIRRVLDDLFGAGFDDLTLWVMQAPIVGAIERAYTPGAKIDQMPVLIGGQGLGKSALVRSLLPPEYPAWAGEGLDLAAYPKERAEALQGRVIVEVSEMAGANRAELQSMKAFISRQDDGNVRLAYRRNPEPTPRRAVLVGTADRPGSLPNDPAGLRRFVPLQLDGNRARCAVEPYIEDRRIQLWAEGLHRYHKGVRGELPFGLRQKAAAAAETHRSKDELLEDKIDSLTLKSGTLAEIAGAIGLAENAAGAVTLPKGMQLRLGAALAARGWRKERRSKGGMRIRGWVAPE